MPNERSSVSVRALARFCAILLAAPGLPLWGCRPTPAAPKDQPGDAVLKQGRSAQTAAKSVSNPDPKDPNPVGAPKNVPPVPAAPAHGSDSGYSSRASSRSSSPQPSSPQNASYVNANYGARVWEEKKDRNAPAGLPNLGNTCFMNAVLQVVAALYADKVEQPACCPNLANCIRSINGRYEVVDGDLVDKLRQSFPVKSRLHAIANSTHQECAAEFLRLLNASHPFLEPWASEPTQNSAAVFPRMVAFDVKDLKNPKTFLKHDPFLSAITQSDGKAYTYYSRASTRLAIWLNRAGPQEVHDMEIEVPSSVRIRQFRGDGTGVAFDLSAFLVHRGGTNGGHYVAYVRKEGKWYRADDALVQDCTNGDALTEAERASFLFYKKNG